MKNLVVNGIYYHNIFQKGLNSLEKYSAVTKEAWDALNNKNLDFINVPRVAYELTENEKEKFQFSNSRIILPYLSNYDTLTEARSTKYMNTEEVLKLYKENARLLKTLHNNNIFHGDIHNENIMINRKRDLCFIDFDGSIIDKYVSKENAYFYEDMMTFSEKIEKTRNDDKVELFAMYIAYLVDVEFMRFSDLHTDIRKIHLDYETQKEIKAYFNGETIPNKDYYFEDIVDDLISKGYESPHCKVKRMK